ncbi:MAG TPA: HAD hydrolase-like protein [Jiangellaceae bacterium]
MSRQLSGVRAVMFDVDGTLVVPEGPGGAGGDLMPRADEVINRLRQCGIRVVVYTNGTTHVPEHYAHELRKHGLPIDDGDLITPALVAATYLERHYPGARVLVIGGDGAREPLLRSGTKVVGPDADEIDVVLVAHDVDINGEKIEAACHAIWNGAAFLATSMARYYFRKGTRGVSLSGAVGAGIAHITETVPTVIGKPSAVSMEAITARTGVDIPEVLVVGDDVDVEIVMGRAAGAPTALVLSGTTGEKPREEIDRLEGDRRPDLVIPDIGHLFSVLPALAGASS